MGERRCRYCALNKYRYVRNNPLRYVDPNCHCFWDACIVAGAAVWVAGAAVAAGAIHYAEKTGQAIASSQPFRKICTSLKDSALALSAALEQLPRDLLEELLNATLNGSKRSMDKCILRVRETENSESGRALQQLADKYEYDVLTRLLEEACRHPRRTSTLRT
jgi:hypothetical protein